MRLETMYWIVCGAIGTRGRRSGVSDTKELLQRIAALRKRLDSNAIAFAPPAPSVVAQETMQTIEDKVQRGLLHGSMIESSIRGAELNDPTQPSLPPVRLTARGSRLIRQGRELLQALRTVSDDPAFQQIEEFDALLQLHREAVAMIEVLLRTVQMFPASVSTQMRMCDGLDLVMRDAEERVTLLCASLARRKRGISHVAELADFLRALATGQPVRLGALQALADRVLEEVRAGLPLRFAEASPEDPARFAAAHGLTVAHVLGRLIHNDPEWKQQLQLAVMATLVHDVGMLRVPAEVLSSATPFTMDQRRLVEKHAAVAAEMLAPLWPGGGWPVDAAVHHHERTDGTGYPAGQKHLEQSAFTRLLAVCDIYTAMCSTRPHRHAHDTRTALTEILFLSERDHLDKKAAELLLVLSFYPIGTIVELNDGSIAIVIATQTGQRSLTSPGRPVVHLVADAQGLPMPWPTVIDLLEHPQRSIVRRLAAEERKNWLYKKYPQLI